MKRHEEPDLPVLHPLPNTVPRALLDSRHKCCVINYAVEDLASWTCGSLRIGLRAMLGSRALAGAHLAGGAWVLRNFV